MDALTERRPVLTTYIGKVLRHWGAISTGILAAAIGEVLRWYGFWPWLPFLVAVGCVVIASFQAWKDERDEVLKLRAEVGVPQVSCVGMIDANGAISWPLLNGGASDAFNVTSLEIRNGRHTAQLVSIDRIRPGESVTPDFETYADGVEELLDSEETLRVALNSSAEGSAYRTFEEAEKMLCPILSVAFRYNDKSGRLFETLCEIQWRCVAGVGQVHHIAMREVPQPSVWSQTTDRLLVWSHHRRSLRVWP